MAMKPLPINLTLSLFAFLMTFDPDWSSKALIFLVLVTFANSDINKFNFKWNGDLKIMAILIFYSIVNCTFLEGTFSSDTFVVVGLCLVFYFIIDHINNRIKININLILKSFLMGVLTVGAINLLVFFYNIGIRPEQLFNAWEENTVIDIQKIYYGMYLNMAQLILIKFLTERKIQLKLFIAFNIAVFTLIYFTGALSGLLLFILINIFHLVYHYYERFYKPIITMFLILPLVFLFVLMHNGFQDVFQQIDGDGSRIRNYNVNKEIVLKRPLFGYGIGNEFTSMQKHRLPASWEYKNKYNAHNQYFQFLIGGGITFLVLFLLFIFHFLYYGNFMSLAFGTILLNTFFVESILQRHHGQIFFSFFLVLIFFSHKIANSKQHI
ncbi:O-antigen ligase family protein [Flagellimonas lutimaris]|uniref:O-antigen ligase family protein n=1 Tax=Flagellimonas lutimaris TaxID=475082 RepID=UPI003F5CDAD3